MLLKDTTHAVGPTLPVANQPLHGNYLSPRNTVSLILAGGRGKRMADLTDSIAKPYLDFAGKFRIIDFTLSNLVNSGFRRIAVLTQYNSHQLLEHLRFGWSDLPGKLNEWIHPWPAHQSLGNDNWYKGTADAIYQNQDSLRDLAPEHVMVLAGDHVYKMDYKYLLEDHLTHQADVTIACMEVPRSLATSFGVAEVDSHDRIQSWIEKSSHPPSIPGKPEQSLASMGIYLFKADVLFAALERDALDAQSHHDFGLDVIPRLIRETKVIAHRFERSCIQNPLRPGAYWRDVGTLDAYWEANLDLTSANPMLNLYEKAWPIHTHMESLPPAKFIHDDPSHPGVTANSLVSAGCIVSGADIHRSILFSNVQACRQALLDEAVVLPGSVIGEGARLRRVVIGPGCHIPPHLIVGDDPVADARRFVRSPRGVTLIAKNMLERI